MLDHSTPIFPRNPFSSFDLYTDILITGGEDLATAVENQCHLHMGPGLGLLLTYWNWTNIIRAPGFLVRNSGSKVEDS